MPALVHAPDGGLASKKKKFLGCPTGCVSNPDSDHNHHKKGEANYLKYVYSSLEESDVHPQVQKSSIGEQPVRSKGEPREAHKPMTFGDLKQNDLTELKSKLNPEPIFSQYTEDIENLGRYSISLAPGTACQLFVSSALVWGLNKVAQQQELRPSVMLPVNLTLKEAIDKFEQDFKAVNLPGGKFVKLPHFTAKWYKLSNSCLEERCKSSIQILLSSVSLPSPLEPLWVRYTYAGCQGV